MGKRSSSTSKAQQQKSKKLPQKAPPPPPIEELFGESRRYKRIGTQGPRVGGCELVAVYRNRISGYVTKTMSKVGNIREAWHGTPRVSTAKYVAVDGLLAPKALYHRGLRHRPGGGMLGPGIYTSPAIEKAAAHAGTRLGKGFCCIFKCLVALGNPHYVDCVGDYSSYRDSPIYDSVVAFADKTITGVYSATNTLRHTEWVVYNSEQVTIDKVLLYWKSPEQRPYVKSRQQLADERAKRHMRGHPCLRNGKICVYAYGNLQPGCIELSKKNCTEDDGKYCTSYRSSRK